ncbi:hypothetical protein [Streptomyces sp. NPDC088744]|uniref:hypothetical protein n=1 Tax=Streptomyces sp. NPDC088744 TaxID=3155061 RepID=UPI0034500463
MAAAAAAIAATATLATIGTTATASAAEKSSVSYSDTTYYGTPKSGTGGLILRDSRGNATSSGIGEGTRFQFLGTCARANGVGLVKVRQIERGGWGSSYTGYVRRAFANLPPSLPC